MNTSDSQGVYNKRDRAITISLTVFCQSFQALSIGGLALLLPLIRQDLGLSFTQGGSLAAATTLVYAFMQIPSGYLADRLSPKRLFVIGILGATVLSLTLGLVMNYWQALANQIAAGFFRALLFSPGMALITGWFPPERRATATGLYLVGGATGNVFFSLVGPWIATAFDWRVAFISIASLGLVAVFFLAKYGKDSPAAIERRKVSVKDIMNLFRYPIMQICGAIQFIRFGVMGGVTYWLPSLLVNEKDLSLPVTGILIAVQSVLMAPSVVIGGYISDRLKNPLLVIGSALLVLSVTSALLVVTNQIFFLVVLVAVNAMFLNIYFGPLFTVPIEALGLRRAGITSGFGNFFASLGGFSMVYILGALKDSTGNFSSGFWTISGMCLLGLILTLILRKVRQRASPEDA